MNKELIVADSLKESEAFVDTIRFLNKTLEESMESYIEKDRKYIYIYAYIRRCMFVKNNSEHKEGQ